MANRIAHRGRDDNGVWTDAEAGIASHIDVSPRCLSAEGHQPMLSANGRWVLSYNGEIYNHLELRQRLESEGAAPAWRGHSDSERCWLPWRLGALRKPSSAASACLRSRCGTAASAPCGWRGPHWRKATVLRLAGRRVPVRLGTEGAACASGFNAPVDRGALALLLRHNYVPGPYSIYAGIHKLPPGLAETGLGQRDAQPAIYWSLADVASAARHIRLSAAKPRRWMTGSASRRGGTRTDDV